MKMGEFNRHRMSPLLPLYETVDSLGAVGGGLARKIESFKASLLRRGFSQQMLYGHHGHTKHIRDHVSETAKPLGERGGRVVRADATALMALSIFPNALCALAEEDTLTELSSIEARSRSLSDKLKVLFAPLLNPICKVNVLAAPLNRAVP